MFHHPAWAIESYSTGSSGIYLVGDVICDWSLLLGVGNVGDLEGVEDAEDVVPPGGEVVDVDVPAL